MSFFITLVEMTDASRRDLEALDKVRSMLHHGLPLDEYRALLHDLHHIVANLRPIMASAASRSAERYPEVRAELHGRMEREQRHETWVLEDIEALGPDAAAGARTPSAPVQAMVGFNYHSAERLHPCSVLGMMYAVEVMSSVYGARAAEAIARSLGLEECSRGLKFLSSHATLNADHFASLSRVLKTVQDPAAQASVVNSARVNFHQLSAMFGPAGFSAASAE